MNLHEMLHDAADAGVPEAEPFAGRMDAIRRRVRNRRNLARAGSSTAGVVGIAGVAAVGTLTWQAARPGPEQSPVPVPELYACGLAYPGVLDLPEGQVEATGAFGGSDGMQVSLTTRLENAGDVSVTTAAPATDVLVTLAGTGEVVGIGLIATSDGTLTLEPGGTSELSTEATLASCGTDAVGPGDPLPDGQYVLVTTGVLTPRGAGPASSAWLSDGILIDVSDGQVSEVPNGDPTGTPTTPAAFAPVCGQIIPAVAENLLWVTASSDVGPHYPAHPYQPGISGLTLDLTIGSTSTQEITGTVSTDTVVVLTDDTGVVLSWWRPGSEGQDALAVAPGAQASFPALAWHPLIDNCTPGAVDDEPLPDGDYRLFAMVTAVVDDGGSPTTWEVLSPPLDLSAASDAVTITGGLEGPAGADSAFEFPWTYPPDFPEGQMPPMDGRILGSSGRAATGWTITGDYSLHGSSSAAVDQAIDRLLPVAFTLESREELPELSGTRATLSNGTYRVDVEVTSPTGGDLLGGYTIMPIG